MSKKKEKGCVLEKMVERRIKKLSKNPFLLAEPIERYCERIKEAAYSNFDDSSYINFNAGEQHTPSGVHQITEAVAMISPKYADYHWIKFSSSEGEISAAEVFIGKVEDQIIGIPQTRVFWRDKIEETGEDYFCEMESFYMIALANRSASLQSDKADNETINYAQVTCFINGVITEWDFYEAPSIDIINEFILYITAALKANPQKRLNDMPKKEVFKELLSRLTMVKENRPASLVGENRCTFGGKIRAPHRKFDRQFKLDAVKLVKEKQLPMYQVAKELSIHNSNLQYWVSKYERFGENAFLGSGSRAHINQNPDASIQNESFTTRLPCADTAIAEE